LASVDFFTVHTVWFEVLFVFIVLTHDRRPSCTSTSQLIQRRNGRRSKYSKPFRLIRHLDICCEIEIESMGVPQPSRGNEYQRSAQRAAVSLATSLRRTHHRLDLPRMPRPCDCVE